MTDDQAIALGTLIKDARTSQGVTRRSLATELSWARSWLLYLETGRWREPSAERIARLAERLNIDPAEIDEITGGYLAHSLPSVRTYFRSKARASQAEIDEIEQVVQEIQDKYRKQDRQ